MKTFLARLTVTLFSLLSLALPGLAGELDDYYLNAYGVQGTIQTSSALQKAILLPTEATVESAHCGNPLKHGLRRDWNKLEPATQKVLAKQLAAPVLAGELTYISPSGSFLIHYTNSGTDAVPSDSWVQTVALTFDNVASQYVNRGWRLAPVVSTTYDVYLRDLSTQKLYGQTTSGQATPSSGFPYAYSSFMEIDNNFTDSIYSPYTANQSLQITAAHEYHHAIQYGYNYYFDIWYAEATSTWYEDELYGNINQLYTYLRASMFNTNLSLDISTDTSTGGGYGRWLFNRHLAEAYINTPIVRNIWEQLAATQPTGNTDIPMTPIIDSKLKSIGSSLSDDIFAYAIKVYTGEWTTDATSVPAVAMTGTFSSYPIKIDSVPSPAITLPHYSFVLFKLPTLNQQTALNITLTRDNGISAVAFRKTANGSSIDQFFPNSGTDLIEISSSNTSSEIVLLLMNSSSNDNLFAGFSTDGSIIQYALPGTIITSSAPSGTPPSVTLSWNATIGATSYQIFRSSTYSTALTAYATTPATSFTDVNVLNDHIYYYSIMPIKSDGLTGPASQVTVAKVPSTSTASTSGGGGGGCFIATAAYGSYLHPQVRVLRDFRDRHLLTNAPGRAFVALYYRISPPLADLIAGHESLRAVARLALLPVVAAVTHPALTGVALLLAGGLLFHRPLRRRLRACEANS